MLWQTFNCQLIRCSVLDEHDPSINNPPLRVDCYPSVKC